MDNSNALYATVSHALSTYKFVWLIPRAIRVIFQMFSSFHQENYPKTVPTKQVTNLSAKTALHISIPWHVNAESNHLSKLSPASFKLAHKTKF